MGNKAFHDGVSSEVWHVYFRFQNILLVIWLYAEKIYHGTESKKYMCLPQGRNSRNEKQKDGEK